MSYAYILFRDIQEKPLRITMREYEEILKVWKRKRAPHEAPIEHIVVRGNIIHRSDIRRVKPPEKPKLDALPEGHDPVRAETIKKVTAEIRRKYPK